MSDTPTFMVSSDGFLLSKQVHKDTIKRIINWKSMGITEKERWKQSNLKLTMNDKFGFDDNRIRPDRNNQDEIDRFYVMELCLPYNPAPDDRDVFIYYNDIGPLCGTAGYMRIRDGYVWNKAVEYRS